MPVCCCLTPPPPATAPATANARAAQVRIAMSMSEVWRAEVEDWGPTIWERATSVPARGQAVLDRLRYVKQVGCSRL